MVMTQSIWARLGDAASLVATPLVPSHYLELVNPLWSTRKLEARVEAVHDETPHARTLTLRPSRAWRTFRAGQHVRIGAAVDGRRVTRTYSIASSPLRGDGCITITVKENERGRLSPFLVRRVRRGDFLSLGTPEGNFVLPEAAPVHPLFVTAGSGITPVMSMLRTYALGGGMPDVAHLHYAPRAREVIFARELAQIAGTHPASYRLSIVHTRETSARFGAEALDALCPDWRLRDVWACGPQSLLDDVARVVDASRLHVERFVAARASLSADGAGGTVRLRSSGVEVRADGATPLLHVAEGAGVNAPYGCRMGLCHTCDATMISGCVRDLRTGQCIDEPGARIQPCVCAAASDVEIDL
jgi:ferredoxin-NADP reductase